MRSNLKHRWTVHLQRWGTIRREWTNFNGSCCTGNQASVKIESHMNYAAWAPVCLPPEASRIWDILHFIRSSLSKHFLSHFSFIHQSCRWIWKKKKKINGIRVIPWVTVMQFVHTNKVIGFWLGIHFSLVQVLVKHLVYIILHCLNSNCTMCGGQNEELFALAVMG